MNKQDVRYQQIKNLITEFTDLAIHNDKGCNTKAMQEILNKVFKEQGRSKLWRSLQKLLLVSK